MNKVATFFRETMLARFLIPAGLILIVFGVITLIITKNNQNYVKTEAEVYNIELEQEAYNDGETQYDATYTLYVKYEVEGNEYQSEISGQSEHKNGDKVTIYYNPDDPSKITQTKSIIFPIIIIVCGIASLIGGIVSAMNALNRHKAMKKQEEGWNNGK